MSVHKAGKYRNLSQGLGLLRLNTLQSGGTSGTSDFGFVAEYNNGGTTTYTGTMRNRADGAFYMFDGLTANPFGTGVVPTDAVNTAGAGFTLAPVKMGALAANGITVPTGNVAVTAGVTAASVTGGSLQMSSATITNTTASGGLTLRGGTTGGVITLGGGSDTVILNANPTSDLGAATKGYVDAMAQGLTYKNACLVRTTLDLAAVAGGITVAGSGSTHTITSTTNASINSLTTYFDGMSNLALGSRVLVMMQGANGGLAKDNGIYTVTSLGSGSSTWQLTRAIDANESSDLTNGACTFINEGTLYASTGWVVTTIAPIVLETTSITFAQFSQLGATTGVQLNLSGFNVFSTQTGGTLNFRAIQVTNTQGANASAILQGTQTTNDISLNIDSLKILGVGALTAGSIASGFGAISTTNAITTTTTMTAATHATTAGGLSMATSVLTFAGASTANIINIPTNLADALNIKDGLTSFLSLVTTTGAQGISINKPLFMSGGSTIQFNGATTTNVVQLTNNLADALTIKDVAGNSYIKFISTTATPTVAVGQATTFANVVTVNADCNLNGGLKQNVQSITNSTILDSTYSIVNATAGATTLTVTLPSASTNIGRQYKIAKIDNGVGSVTVAVAAGDYIDGVQNDTIVLSSQYDHVMVSCQYSGGVGYWFVY